MVLLYCGTQRTWQDHQMRGRRMKNLVSGTFKRLVVCSVNRKHNSPFDAEHSVCPWVCQFYYDQALCKGCYMFNVYHYYLVNFLHFLQHISSFDLLFPLNIIILKPRRVGRKPEIHSEHNPPWFCKYSLKLS